MKALKSVSRRDALIICIFFACAAVLASYKTPPPQTSEPIPDLQTIVPHAFGDWSEVPDRFVPVAPTNESEHDINQPYDQILMRTYQNALGQTVMLAIAWGGNQRQEVKIHRPDLCYVAQGYVVRSINTSSLQSVSVNGSSVQSKRMVVLDSNHGEAVNYWMRIGKIYSEDAFDTRLHIFEEGFSGRRPDGVLVRASQLITHETDAEKSWPVLENFLSQLVQAVPAGSRTLLIK